MGNRIVLGGFAWLLAFSFGAAVIDSVYARALLAMGDAQPYSDVFNEVSDLLQLPAALSLLAGIGALVIAVRHSPSRWLVVAALCLILVPFALYVLIGGKIEEAGFGTALRLVSGALASVCAMLAALAFTRS